MQSIDYDSVATLYDAYATADCDVPLFTDEARRAWRPELELTSGTGRLSVPLAEAEADLTCVDCSRGMLDILAQKLADRGLAAEVRYVDACRLELPQRFALAILPFQWFMEFVGEGRQRSLLAAVFACLRPGGRFICTKHNPAIRRPLVDGKGGDGPLMRAALDDSRIPMMELLVAHGADVNAVWGGHYPVVLGPCETFAPRALKWMIDHGADLNAASK